MAEVRGRAEEAALVSANLLLHRSIETLHEYVLVDPDTREVEHRKKITTDQWLSTFLRGGELRLESLDIVIAIEALWKDLERLAGGPAR